MLCLNVSSLPAHYDEISHLALSKTPLSIALSETCLISEILNSEIDIEGYNIERVDSDSRHTGGALLYIRKDVKVIETKYICRQKYYWIVSSIILFKNVKYLIASIYRSPSQNPREFETFFQEWCEENACDKKFPLVLAGDYNIDFNDPNISKNFRDAMCDVGICNLVNEITRSGRTKDSILDLILTNNEDVFKTNVLVTPKVTDHYIVQVKLENTKLENTVSPLKVKTRGRNINFTEINNILANKEFRYHHANIDEKCEYLIKEFTHALDSVAPLRTVKIFPRFKEWWNDRVREAARVRDASYKEYIRDKCSERYDVYKKKNETIVLGLCAKKKENFMRKRSMKTKIIRLKCGKL